MTPTESRCPHCGRALGDDAERSAGADQNTCPHCGRSSGAPQPVALASARWARRALAAGVALLFLGVAAWVLVVTLEDRIQQQTAIRAAERATSELNSSASMAIATLLFILPGRGDTAPACLALGEPGADVDGRSLAGARESLLAREIVRQALLIAARDELGLATRDAMLGDWRGNDNQNEAAGELVIRFQPGGSSRALVRRRGHDPGETLLESDLKDVVASLSEETPDDLGKLVEIAESLSRKEFRDVLRKLGADGTANAKRPDASVPGGVEERLLRLGYTEPFEALRLLHSAQRKDGESPARLGAVVRGYALLGVLTEFHWHPAHEAFKARSLLYAQRLFARDPGRSWGLWHRAFAETLAGLHKNALADLILAKASAKAEAASATPEWAGLVEAAARCDAIALKAQRGRLAPLAGLLRLAQVETDDAPSLLDHTARELLAIDPECLRAIDAMCGLHALKILDRATLLGPQTLTETLRTRLNSIADLPKSVADRIGGRDRVAFEVAESLVAAGEDTGLGGEPSWGVLGQLIRESTFVQVYRRLSFLKEFRTRPVDSYWSAAQTGVAGHRFGHILESLVSLDGRRRPTDGKIDHELSAPELGISEREILRCGAVRTDSEKSVIRSAIASHVDHVSRELCLLIAEDLPAGEMEKARVVRRLLAVSPHSPFGRAKLIEADWDASAIRAPDWQKEARRSPAVIGAVARRATSHGQFRDAERFLTEYIAVSPDAWAYEMLAGVYRSRGNTPRWLATLQEFLKNSDDSGPDQARIQVQIADHYMNLGLWTHAWAYAEKAGATWVRGAMQSALRCAIGMKDWKNAELWARRISERYPESSWDEWFLFCKRTGRGDVASARAFALQQVAASSGRAGPANLQDFGFFYWLDCDLRKALESFRRASESPRTMESGFYAILVADALGDTSTRDELYQSFVKHHRRDAPKTVEIWEILRKGTERPKLDTFDTHPVDQIISGLADQNRWHMQFLVGEYFGSHGMKGLARAYLERCAKSPYATKWFTGLAWDQVREIDNKIEKPKGEARGGF